MKNIARALAFALGLSPLMAMAQVPPNLPANSVWGRLGFPGTVGPSQQIPFATLTRQFFSAAAFQVGNPGNAALYSQMGTAANTTVNNAMQLSIGTALGTNEQFGNGGGVQEQQQAVVGTVQNAVGDVGDIWGVVGYAKTNSSSTNANAVGVGGYGKCAAATSSCWGGNFVAHNMSPIVANHGVAANWVAAQENDLGIWLGPGGTEQTINNVFGLYIYGGGDSARNQGSGVAVAGLSVVTGAKFANGFISEAGAAEVAFVASATSKANSSASQPMQWQAIDSGGNALSYTIQGDASSNFIIQTVANGAVGLGDPNGNYVVANAALGGAKVKFPALAVAGFIANDASGSLSTSPFGTSVKTALGVNVGSAGAPVLFNGAGGTPSAIALTNATGTAAGLTAGNVTTNANVSGDCTSSGSNAVTCLKTNGSSFGTAATQNTGTAGATIPLLNGANTWSGAQTHSGQIITTFGVPTIASGACGTGTNGTISGTNQAGTVTIGAVATTSCTVSFSATITAPNACVITPGNATAAAQGTTLAWVGAPSTTQWVINGIALASAVYRYHCI